MYKPYLESEWLTDYRKMSLFERILVGYRLWKNGVATRPFIAKQTNKNGWITKEEKNAYK